VKNLYIDGHCHLYAFKDNEIENILKSLNISIIAISDDKESSIRTLQIANAHNNIIPCVGIHPWNIKSIKALDDVIKIADYISQAKCIGEVGLDKRFNADNYKLQLEAFYQFVEQAVKYKKPLNIHALDAWKEAYDIVSSMGVRYAIFHWYSGPIDVLKKIYDSGYLITINPSVEFQKKHGKVLKESPIDIILTESDGPYNYRGRELHPNMIPRLVSYIAETKNLEISYVIETIKTNLNRILRQ